MILYEFLRRQRGRSSVPGVQLIGVEIELEGIPFHPAESRELRRFNYVEDGSLRGNAIELVTSPPLNLSDVMDSMESARSYMAQCTSSFRTSIHVHMDMRRFTSRQVASIVLLYAAFEDVFFRASGDRRGNPFCMSLNSMDFLHEIQRAVAGWRAGDWAPLPPLDMLKYCALNLGHLYDYGTLEFRHHVGTTNVDEVKVWIQRLNDFVQWAASKECDKVMNMNPSRYNAWATQITRIMETSVVLDYYDALLNVKAVM